MTPKELIADLRTRINPAYENQIGTDSWERKLCADALDKQAAEIQRLTSDLRDGDALRERMADILSRTAIALRGKEPPLTRWGWHDLPDRAYAAIGAGRKGEMTPDERIDAALDSVLKASGSALRHYTMEKTLADMREAMRKVMSDAYIQGSNDNFEALKKAGHEVASA